MVNPSEHLDKKDEELVALTLKNQDFFACLIEKYQSKLSYYICRISNFSDEQVEDTLQEVFIKVYQNLYFFDSSLKFSSWIYRITHNEVISKFRKHKSRPQKIYYEANENILNTLKTEFDSEKEIDLDFLAKHISSAMQKIDQKYQEVLILKYFEEKDYYEISDILKKPVGTIGTLINRAKKKMIEALDQEELT